MSLFIYGGFLTWWYPQIIPVIFGCPIVNSIDHPFSGTPMETPILKHHVKTGWVFHGNSTFFGAPFGCCRFPDCLWQSNVASWEIPYKCTNRGDFPVGVVQHGFNVANDLLGTTKSWCPWKQRQPWLLEGSDGFKSYDSRVSGTFQFGYGSKLWTHKMDSKGHWFSNHVLIHVLLPGCRGDPTPWCHFDLWSPHDLPMPWSPHPNGLKPSAPKGETERNHETSGDGSDACRDMEMRRTVQLVKWVGPWQKSPSDLPSDKRLQKTMERSTMLFTKASVS